MSLVQQITTAFVDKRLDLSERDHGVGKRRERPPGQGWDTLPEFEQVKRLRERCLHDASYDETSVRLFLTFTSAMDRARDSTRLWQSSADLLLNHNTRWMFEPSEIATCSFTELGELLSDSGVSQRYAQDTAAWRAIGEVLADPARVPPLYNVIYGARGDAGELLRAVTLQSGARRKWKLLPNLGGLKIAPMWVRMLVSLGEVPVTNLQELRVAVDIQVHRVTYYLGLTNKRPRTDDINKKLTSKIQTIWQQDIEDAIAPEICEQLNGTAGALDPALWFIGKWGCTYCEEQEAKVPIADFCDNCRLNGGHTATESTGMVARPPERRSAEAQAGTSGTIRADVRGAGQLSPVQQEHFEVAQELDAERRGQAFSAKEFKERYLRRFPTRAPGSIMPAGYSMPSSDSDRHYPKFLRKVPGGYVFTGPPTWLSD